MQGNVEIENLEVVCPLFMFSLAATAWRPSSFLYEVPVVCVRVSV